MTEEKIFTISLGEAWKKAPVKRANYAAAFVKSYLKRNTDAETIKLGSHLNSALWSRGTGKPPRAVRVKALIDGGIAKVELFGHDYVEFKPTSVVKREKMIDKLKARLSPKEAQQQELEEKIEGKKTKDEKAEGEPKTETKTEGKQENPPPK